MVEEHPLIVVLGPTASGKTALALDLAEHFHGEIVSCDSVAVYRELEIGTAKPSHQERARVPHHLLDVFSPDEQCTAGDYARLARQALEGITHRGHLPIISGGTGLYLRALLDGLFAAKATDQALRTRLKERAGDSRRGAPYLHRLLGRLDADAARRIHPHDVPKVTRAIEATLAGHRPLSEQWSEGRAPLTGYRVLRLGLAPARDRLAERINQRAADMFSGGLVEETERLIERYGFECRPLGSLGYAQARALLRGDVPRDEAVTQAQQGHRQYAKRQRTWFRREAELHDVNWLPGFGGEAEVQTDARRLVRDFLAASPPLPGGRSKEAL